MKNQEKDNHRLWSKIAVGQQHDCWIWKGAKDRKGYGLFRSETDKTTRAHRAVWKEKYGNIPNGLFVCHACDVPACCNPSHLFLGTPAENTSDMMQKHRNRNPWGEQTGSAKLTEEQVVGVMARLLTGREKHQDIADSLGVTISTVRDIWYGRRWNKLFHPFNPYNRNISYPQNRKLNMRQEGGPAPRPRG